MSNFSTTEFKNTFTNNPNNENKQTNKQTNKQKKKKKERKRKETQNLALLPIFQVNTDTKAKTEQR